MLFSIVSLLFGNPSKFQNHIMSHLVLIIENHFPEVLENSSKVSETSLVKNLMSHLVSIFEIRTLGAI